MRNIRALPDNTPSEDAAEVAEEVTELKAE